MSLKFEITNPVYDKVYDAYAWRDNNRTLSLVQGEGITFPESTAANTTITVPRAKAPRFRLRDDRGIISLSSSPEVMWAVHLPDGTEDLVVCNIVTGGGITAADGIIEIPIVSSVTRYSGHARGEIRVVTANSSNNNFGGTTKFFGINACIGEGVSDEAAEQSPQFTALISALQKVVAITNSGNATTGTAALATLTDGGDLRNSTDPVSSGNLKTYLEGNYQTYLKERFPYLQYAHETHSDSYDVTAENPTDTYSDGGVYIDEALSTKTLYRIKNSGNAVIGIMFCATVPGQESYGVTQFKILYTGEISTRHRSNSGTWGASWYKIETRQKMDTVSLTNSDDKYPSSKLVTTQLATKVDKSTTIAGINLQNPISAGDLAVALGGKTLYYQSGTSTSVSYSMSAGIVTASAAYPVPTLLHTTDDNAFIILYSRSETGGVYQYEAFKVPKFALLAQTFNSANYNASSGELIVDSDGVVRLYTSSSNYITLVPDSRTIAGLSLSSNITRAQLAKALTGSDGTIYYHTQAGAPTNSMSTLYPAPTVWRDSSTGIYYITYTMSQGGTTYYYDWRPLTNACAYTSDDFNAASTAGKPGTVAIITDETDSTVQTIYICTADNTWNSIYTKNEIDVLLSNAKPKVFTYILSSSSWGSNQQTIALPSSYVATGDVIADIEIDATAYAQMLSDGCTGIVVSSTFANSTLTLTAIAFGTAPTANITAQITLTPVDDISEVTT